MATGDPIPRKWVKRYVLCGGLRCPYCDSANIETSVRGDASDGGWITRQMECSDCLSEWLEIYSLTYIEPIEP